MSSPTSSDVPPPLPQRNMPRKSSSVNETDQSGSEVNLRRPIQISDLDHSHFGSSNALGNLGSPNNNKSPSSPTSSPVSNKQSASKSRPKAAKIKALSDPKMSSALFIEMEQSLSGAAAGGNTNEPPPLPPRQPGMLEEKQNLLNNNKFPNPTGPTTNYNNRPPPNSLDTLLVYPLTTTTQAVRDFSGYPRPNAQHIMQLNSVQPSAPYFHPTTTSQPNSSISKATVSNSLTHTNSRSQYTDYLFLSLSARGLSFSGHISL